MPSEIGIDEPITPMEGGKPPGWVVMCLDCGFACDAHGLTGEDAVKAVAPRHESTHKLVAQAVNYLVGFGPQKDQPHPLYRVRIGEPAQGDHHG